jgi:hypothetical protein
VIGQRFVDMELWHLHLIMFFSCLLVFTLAVVAIRRYFLGRRHLKSEMQGPRRKGDGPIIRSKNDSSTAAEAASIAAVTTADAFASSVATSAVKPSDVKIDEKSEKRIDADHDYVEALRQISLLAVVTEKDLVRLARHVRVVAAAAGDVIFSAGDVAATIYVVKTGSVTVSSEENDDTLLLKSGEVFGQQALELGTEVYSSSAVAETACHLFSLDRLKVSSELPRLVIETKTSSMKSAAAAVLFSSSMAKTHSAASSQAVELHGISHSAPTLIPQQQAPSSLLSTHTAPRPLPTPPLHPNHDNSQLETGSLPQPPGAAPASGSAARVPKSLLRKHAMLFDSDSSAV